MKIFHFTSIFERVAHMSGEIILDLDISCATKRAKGKNQRKTFTYIQCAKWMSRLSGMIFFSLNVLLAIAY